MDLIISIVFGFFGWCVFCIALILIYRFKCRQRHGTEPKPLPAWLRRRK